MTKAFKSAWGAAGAAAIATGQKDTEAKHVTDRQTIAANPLNARDIDPASDDIRELAESLAEVQLHAIPVVPVEEFLAFDGYRELYAGTLARLAYVDEDRKKQQVKFVAIGGGRRLVAAEVGNIARLEISIKKGLNREAFLRLTVIENLAHKDLTPLEEARQIKLLRDATGDSYAVLGEKLNGRTKGFIAQRLDLLNLSPELQDELASGALNVTIARELVRRIKDELGPDAGDDATIPGDQQREILDEIRAGQHGDRLPRKRSRAAGGTAHHDEPTVYAVNAETAETAAEPRQETAPAPASTAAPTPVPAPRKAGRPRKPAADKVRDALRGETDDDAIAGVIDAFSPDRIAAGMTKRHGTALVYATQPDREAVDNLTAAGITGEQVSRWLTLMTVQEGNHR